MGTTKWKCRWREIKSGYSAIYSNVLSNEVFEGFGIRHKSILYIYFSSYSPTPILDHSFHITSPCRICRFYLDKGLQASRDAQGCEIFRREKKRSIGRGLPNSTNVLLPKIGTLWMALHKASPVPK